MKKVEKKEDSIPGPAPQGLPPVDAAALVRGCRTLEQKRARMALLTQQRLDIVRNLGVTEGAIAILSEQIEAEEAERPRNRAERRAAEKAAKKGS